MSITKYAALLALCASSALAQTGVWRTAITLADGTQEIYPDTLVTRFDRVSRITPQGTVEHCIAVVARDGRTLRTVAADSIVEMNYRKMSRYEQWAGDWWLVASPNGEANEVGIMLTTVESMPVHAVLPAPGSPGYGTEVLCHIDSVAHRKGLKYDANFKLRYSEAADGRSGTIAMVLDDQQPLTTAQYAGGPDTYAWAAPGRTYYYGVSPLHADSDTTGRHMYFVSQNIDTQALEGMELIAGWTAADLADATHEYTLPRMQQIYWIVALDIPYSHAEHDELGIIDIFASPRLCRRPWVRPDDNEP